MKKSITLAFFLCCLGVAIFAQTPVTPPNGETAPPAGDGVLMELPAPVITFEEMSFDFGKIPFGVPVTHQFKFTNTGTAPLKIEQARPSCGCTNPDWTREEVLPGASGFVSATFNAQANGNFEKSVTVISNANPAAQNVTFKGSVQPQEADPALDMHQQGTPVNLAPQTPAGEPVKQ